MSLGNIPKEDRGLEAGTPWAAPPAADERWDLALRVASAAEFSKSPRLRNFLLYVCQKALSGSEEELHEPQIGSMVFGRRPGYNSSEDNIVRVEARELRKRLTRYFEGEGKAERLRIRIPKGGYAPVFEPQDRAAQPGALTPVAGENEPSARGVTARPPAARAKSPWIIAALSVLVALLLAANFRTLRRPATARSSSSSLGAAGLPGSVWPLLFNSQHPTNIVVSDCPLVMAESLTGKVIPLKDYIDKRYISELKPDIARSVASSEWTSLADSMIIAKIVKATAPLQSTVTIRYARSLSVRDLESSNLVFLGSSYSDPWISEFDPERNFVVELIPTRATLAYRNRSARPGEPAWYYAYGKDGKSDETYGLVTFLPNLHHNGNVLILEGTTTEGTEAAGDFMTDSNAASRLRKALKLKSGEALPYFQLLLKTTMLGGAATKMQAVAYRVIPNP